MDSACAAIAESAWVGTLGKDQWGELAQALDALGGFQARGVLGACIESNSQRRRLYDPKAELDWIDVQVPLKSGLASGGHLLSQKLWTNFANLNQMRREVRASLRLARMALAARRGLPIPELKDPFGGMLAISKSAEGQLPLSSAGAGGAYKPSSLVPLAEGR